MRAWRYVWEDVDVTLPRLLVWALAVACIDATLHLVAQIVEVIA